MPIISEVPPPKQCNPIRKRNKNTEIRKNNPMKKIFGYLSVYVRDSRVRHNVGILLGILINSLYIIINLIWGIKHRNVWFVTVAVYHMLVALMRFFSIDAQSGEAGGGETVGALMAVLSVPMTGMIAYTVITSSARGYPRASLPIFSAYAVFSIFRAIYGLISTRRERGHFARTSYVARLSLALMSLFNLQTSLFAFWGFDSHLSVFFNFVTGGAFSLSMLALARQGRTFFK